MTFSSMTDHSPRCFPEYMGRIENHAGHMLQVSIPDLLYDIGYMQLKMPVFYDSDWRNYYNQSDGRNSNL